MIYERTISTIFCQLFSRTNSDNRLMKSISDIFSAISDVCRSLRVLLKKPHHLLSRLQGWRHGDGSQSQSQNAHPVSSPAFSLQFFSVNSLQHDSHHLRHHHLVCHIMHIFCHISELWMWIMFLRIYLEHEDGFFYIVLFLKMYCFNFIFLKDCLQLFDKDLNSSDKTLCFRFLYMMFF